MVRNAPFWHHRGSNCRQFNLFLFNQFFKIFILNQNRTFHSPTVLAEGFLSLVCETEMKNACTGKRISPFVSLGVFDLLLLGDCHIALPLFTGD